MKKTQQIIFTIIPTAIIAFCLIFCTFLGFHDISGFIDTLIRKPHIGIPIILFDILIILPIAQLFSKKTDNKTISSQILLYGSLIFWVLFIVLFGYVEIFEIIIKIRNSRQFIIAVLGLYFLTSSVYNLRNLSQSIKPKYIYYLCVIFATPLLGFEVFKYTKKVYNDYITIDNKEELYNCTHPNSITNAKLFLTELNAVDLDKFTQFPSIKDIELIDCYMDEIPDSWQKMKNLTYLTIYNNDLYKIPANIYKINSLEHLKVAGDSLREITAGIGRLKNLKGLSFGDYMYGHSINISIIPEEVSQLDSLRYLELRACSISSLPKGLCELKKLEEIDATSTNLRSIPICLKNNKQLKILIYKDDIPQRELDSLKLIFGNMIVVK